MYSKSIVVSDRPSGYAQTTVSKTDEQPILPLKTLIRKRASRYLLLKWSGKKLNLTKMSSHL
jgi:hypothetical protein